VSSAAQAATRSNPKGHRALSVEYGAIRTRCGVLSVEHGAIRDQHRAETSRRSDSWSGAIRITEQSASETKRQVSSAEQSANGATPG